MAQLYRPVKITSCLIGLACGALFAMGGRLGADVMDVSPFTEFTTVNLYHLRGQLQAQQGVDGGALNAPEYGPDVGAELLNRSWAPIASLAFGFRIEDVSNTMSESGDAAEAKYNSYLLAGLVGMRWTAPIARRWTVSLGLFAGPGYANIGYGRTQSGGASENEDWDGFGFVSVADLRLEYALPSVPGMSLNADLGGRYASFGPLSYYQEAHELGVQAPAWFVESTPSGEDFSGIISGVGVSYDF
jgi:hypothetical protein